MISYEEELEAAVEIAEEASEIALSYFRQALLIETKADGSPVTMADKKVEEYIRLQLKEAFPKDGILGEEFGEADLGASRIWTIDPIDGTRSFIKGIPLFGTLLGLLDQGTPVLGVLVLPAIGETYAAAQGMGTHCNGVSVRVSPSAVLESSFISLGDRSCFALSGNSQYLEKIIEKAGVSRAYTDCFGHSLVIRGAVDAMIDPIVSVWDIAPIACLVKEAGGVYFNLDGEEKLTGNGFVSATSALKAQLIGL